MPLSEISASVLYVICANLNIKQVLILILFNFQYAWKIGGSFDEKKIKSWRKRQNSRKGNREWPRGRARDRRSEIYPRAPQRPDFANYFRMLEKINTRPKAKVHTNLHWKTSDKKNHKPRKKSFRETPRRIKKNENRKYPPGFDS